MTKLYKIVRFYQNNRKTRTMNRNLTLKQAQDWCNDPNTSSMTKGNPSQKTIDRWHEEQKHWFDGYTEQ